mgnify:CR=1 FL=1|jgi:hypothetical protein
MDHHERLKAIDMEEMNPIHQGKLERLEEALDNLKSNRRRYPAGLHKDAGPCYCPQHESHAGRCLGPECYCH